jgi:hypothetical protein
MQHIGVLKRAWHIVWSYRALWIFGIIFALVTFSWGPWALLDSDDDWEREAIVITTLDGETFWDTFQRTMRTEMTEANQAFNELLGEDLGLDVQVHLLTVIGIMTALAVVAFIVAKIARYVSETALIRMVGAYQETGERLRVRQGLRMGWSRSAWRLFLVNLIIDLMAALAAILLFVLIFATLPLWVNGPEGVIFVFAFLTAGLFFIALAAVIVLAALTSAWKRMARQACALDGMGVTEAVGRGFTMVRRHLRDVGLTWLITAGVGLGWTAAIVPLVILLLGAGLIIGGLPGLAGAGLVSGGGSEEVPIFVGLAVGLPILLLVLIGPLVFLDGLREVLVSSLWTLTYRELHGLALVEPERVPGLDAPGMDAPGLEVTSAA